MLFNFSEDETDEETSIKVKTLRNRAIKNKEKNDAKRNEKDQQKETNRIQNSYPLQNRVSRQQEIESKLNQINQSVLHSPPANEKCDSSKQTTHSSAIERRQ